MKTATSFLLAFSLIFSFVPGQDLIFYRPPFNPYSNIYKSYQYPIFPSLPPSSPSPPRRPALPPISPPDYDDQEPDIDPGLDPRDGRGNGDDGHEHEERGRRGRLIRDHSHADHHRGHGRSGNVEFVSLSKPVRRFSPKQILDELRKSVASNNGRASMATSEIDDHEIPKAVNLVTIKQQNILKSAEGKKLINNVDLGVDNEAEPLLANFNSTIYACQPVINVEHNIQSNKKHTHRADDGHEHEDESRTGRVTVTLKPKKVLASRQQSAASSPAPTIKTDDKSVEGDYDEDYETAEENQVSSVIADEKPEASEKVETGSIDSDKSETGQGIDNSDEVMATEEVEEESESSELRRQSDSSHHGDDGHMMSESKASRARHVPSLEDALAKLEEAEAIERASLMAGDDQDHNHQESFVAMERSNQVNPVREAAELINHHQFEPIQFASDLYECRMDPKECLEIHEEVIKDLFT